MGGLYKMKQHLLYLCNNSSFEFFPLLLGVFCILHSYNILVFFVFYLFYKFFLIQKFYGLIDRQYFDVVSLFIFLSIGFYKCKI